VHVLTRRPRSLFTAIAVAVSILGFNAQPAHAGAPPTRPCGAYLHAWNYWTNEWYTAFMAAGQQVTPYVAYAASQANDYLDLWNNYGCTVP
jgi:hypothetical protein